MDIDQIDPRSIDVSHEVQNLSFRFYSDTEAQRLSVRRLTSPYAFDEIGRAIPRGLYDPALGPVSYDEGPCLTCGLSYKSCPGHFGHIELPIPVPHPLLMKLIIKILRSSCWNCPCLRVPSSDLNLLLARLYFEDANLPKCGFAVEAFRTLRKRHTPKDSVAAAEHTEKETVNGSLVKNWREFFKSLPKPLSTYVRDLGSNDVQLVERNMLQAAQDAWKKASEKGQLAPHRSAGWKETIRLILPSSTVMCPQCFTKPPSCRVGIRGRLFRMDSRGETLLSPAEIENHIGKVWEAHSEVFELLFGLKGRIMDEKEDAPGHRRLFVRIVLVPPSRFRPTSVVGDMTYAAEHPQNMFFQRLLTEIEIIMISNEYGLREEPALFEAVGHGIKKDDPKIERPTKARFAQAMSNMQEALRDLYDSSGTSQGGAVQKIGIRQQLEAKNGLFRQHMMGKRVNFSCRSVIGPDVFLDTDEIGIPESFAKLLTVPEPVIPANLSQMQRAVLNGPDVYPGAVAVEDWTTAGEYRVVQFRSSKNKGLLSQQAGLLIQNRVSKGVENSKTGLDSLGGSHNLSTDTFQTGVGVVPKRVHRHLKTGDIVLFNRQPTLHRVSIMAHKVRVLPGERTIRFHYANCGSYNADFDGDEMNVHIPQDYLARAEAKELMLSSRHYIVPTSGAPIRGLIQDHIVAATLLSQRDTFLEKDDFMQFLFSATDKLMTRPGRGGSRYEIPEPTTYKPRRLWTGKQLISAVLAIVRNGRAGLNLTAVAKTTSNVIGKEESTVIFRNGELLQGIVDKSSLGSSMYGIVHAVQETYGCDASDEFLSSMSRLCVHFLRYHGHTTGVDDILLKEHGEQVRRAILRKCADDVGVSVTNSVYSRMSKGDKKRLPKATSLLEARQLVEEMIRRDGKEAEDRLDTAINSALNKVSSEVMKECVPAALKKSFPRNGFALMTNTGAKGGAVNSAQISCLLGSTVLEGKRVPRMGGSGATLPCFHPFDASPVAGGFIPSRFLTGISPHEFFFHAMSGREGLLDTSLKTANSGYLQRCLVKHLEGVRLHYDFTVRDSDRSVLQFIYGDDGVDPSKSRWLNDKIDWQLSNEKCLKITDEDSETEAPILRASHRQHSSSDTMMEKLSPGALSRLGVTSESYNTAVEEAERQYEDKADFDVRNFLESRYRAATMQPGEAVGVLAAQGVGEPSTQMTLNTFHHAGSSSAHVTLGIPRLRELLMTASKYPKTPSMTLHVRGKDQEKVAAQLRQRLQNIKLVDLLLGVDSEEVGICLAPGRSDVGVRVMQITMHIPHEELYAKPLGFSFKKIISFVGDSFLPCFHNLMKRELRRISSESGIDSNGGLALYLRIAQKPQFANTEAMQDDDEDPGDGSDVDLRKGNDSREDADMEAAERSEDDYSSSDEESDRDEVEENDEERDSRKRLKTLISEHAEDESQGEVVKAKKKVRPRQSEQEIPISQNEGALNGYAGNNSESDNADETGIFGQFGYVGDSLQENEKEKIVFRWALPTDVFGKLDLAASAKEAAAKLKVAHVERISKCFIDKPAGKGISVITEGSNIAAILEKGHDLVDLNRLETNDMFGILCRYGVEAMRSALIQEFVKVFKAYGIPVNIRHLQLIADYMTANGSYRGFNRRAMDSTPSPFQRMTFETSVTFLTDSALNSTEDQVKNPSAAVAIGKVYEGGTGGFQLLQNIS